ncbi:MAG: Cas9 inhibitor AcrIIA9 family protein [Coprobacillus sp.]
MDKFMEELKTVNDPAIKKVAQYLLSRDDIQSNLAKENKSLKEMWGYIRSKAQKHAKDNCACINDETVYGWAVHYYDEDDIKIEQIKNSAVKSGKDKANVNIKQEVSSATNTKKDTIKKVKQKINDNQLSFDDLLGI